MTSETVAENVAAFMHRSPNVELVEVYFKSALVAGDRDDDKFVDCGLNGNADLIVTDDRHFAALTEVPFPSIPVMSTPDFVSYLRRNGFGTAGTQQ